MTKVKRRRPTKVSDQHILMLNSMGYSAETISKELDIHKTTVGKRLKANGIQLSNPNYRGNFMEHVYKTMTAEQLEWVSEKLSPTFQISDYIEELIKSEYIKQTNYTKD